MWPGFAGFISRTARKSLSSNTLLVFSFPSAMRQKGHCGVWVCSSSWERTSLSFSSRSSSGKVSTNFLIWVIWSSESCAIREGMEEN